jgi:hypothetical protein
VPGALLGLLLLGSCSTLQSPLLKARRLSRNSVALLAALTGHARRRVRPLHAPGFQSQLKRCAKSGLVLHLVTPLFALAP